MKKCKKLLAFTAVGSAGVRVLCCSGFCFVQCEPVRLEATLVTDKESYKANEEIHGDRDGQKYE